MFATPRSIHRHPVVFGALTFALIAALGTVAVSPETRFVVGGAMINVGYRLQDHLDAYDLHHHEGLRPDEIWKELAKQNHLAAAVRKQFPRSARHPLVAMVVCMDARVDTVELTGDTRKYYYVVRTAGSVLGEKEEDMLELAVANGVKVIVLTTHTDCAAEKMARDPAQRKLYPNLAAAIDEREKRVRELLERPLIAKKIASGELIVKRVNVDTMTEELLPAKTM
jgi:carbonic anhydrase